MEIWWNNHGIYHLVIWWNSTWQSKITLLWILDDLASYKAPFSSWISQPEMFDYQRVPGSYHHSSYHHSHSFAELCLGFAHGVQEPSLQLVPKCAETWPWHLRLGACSVTSPRGTCQDSGIPWRFSKIGVPPEPFVSMLKWSNFGWFGG